MKPPLPSDEAARLKALQQYQILDTPPEKEFDDLTRLAAHICGTPAAQISIVDTDRQWFKSKIGLDASETPRDIAFCAHTILQPQLFIIRDAHQDNRFADSPLVKAEPKIRFYAGAPLITPEGHALGALCVMDQVPRDLSPQQQEALEILARQVMGQLQLRCNLAVLEQAVEKHKQSQTALSESEERYRRLVELSPETIAIYSEGKFDYINHAGAKLLGAADPAEIAGKPIKDFLLLNRQHQLLANQPNSTAAKFVRLDGAVIDVEVTSIPITDRNQPATQIVARDVTQRRQVEILLQQTHEQLEQRVEERTAALQQTNQQLQSEIAERQRAEEEVSFLQRMVQAINESADFPSALSVTLLQVCEFTGWNYGEAWIPSADQSKLECSQAWCGNDQNLDRFKQISEKFTFPPAIGLPGRVWFLKQPEWVENIASELDTVFLRRRYATKVGLRSGLGLPIVYEDQVLAVIVFFMYAAHERNKRLIEMVSTVATQLGTLFQRKQTEVGLRESEERYRAVVEQTSEGIFLVDADTKQILEANAAFLQLLGYSDHELLRLSIYDVLALDSERIDYNHQRIDRKLQQVLQEKHCFIDEVPHRRKDGALVEAEVSINLIFYSGRNVYCITVRDISERKRAEAALHSSMATNRALINAIPDVIFRLSKDGVFVNYKAANEDDLPVPSREFLGKNIREVLPAEVAQPTLNCISAALHTGEIQTFEYQLLVRQQLRDYEARLVVSAVDEVMAIVRDITERKRADVDIRNALAKEKELSQLKSRFVSMTSHEFRTPLTTILSSAELVQDYGDRWTPEKKFQHLQRIVTAVKHMTQLLNDVLLIGKADAGRLEFNPAEMDLVKFCRDLVDEIQLSSPSHAIAFESQSNCFDVYLDEKLLRLILSNLLTNAIKYSPPGSTVDLTLAGEQGDVVLQVKDRGIGIPVADQEQLFDSFYRASNVGTISGTGLGLAIVKKAVDLHDGKITVASEVELGTTFTVLLPLKTDK